MNDGVTNLEKYALGIPPLTKATASKLPQVTVSSINGTDYLAMRFRQLTAPTDLQYNVQESTDLVNWNIVNPAVYQIGGPTDNGDGTQTITIQGTVPMDRTNPKAFLRLQIQDTSTQM